MTKAKTLDRGKAAPRKGTQKPTTEKHGRLLAVEFLREMETYQIDDANCPWPWSIEAMFRPIGTQQDNVMLRHIDAMQGNRAALAGFCAALTDYIGNSALGGGTPFPWVYRKLTERDINGDLDVWPVIDPDGNKTFVRVADWKGAQEAVQKLLSDALPNGEGA